MDTTAAPAAAEPKPVLSPAEMNDAQLSEFFAKGTRFEKDAPADDTTSDDTAADSSPAKPAEQVASTDASSKAAASETAKPEHGKKGKGLKARVEQLDQGNEGLSQRLSAALRRRRELNDQLADAEREPQSKPKADAKPASSPAAPDKPAEANWKRFRDLPGAPKIGEFTGEDALEDFVEAKAAFIAEKLAEEKFDRMFTDRQEKSHAEQEQHREFAEAATVAEERAKADEARHPQWREQLDPALAAIPPLRALPQGAKPNALNFIKDQVMFEAEHPVSLMVFLSSDEGKAWAAQLVKLPPQRIVREIAIKDASFAASDDDETTPSLVSKAPPPGETLGRKPSKPVDPLKAAQESGNVEDFINQRNRQVVGAGKR